MTLSRAGFFRRAAAAVVGLVVGDRVLEAAEAPTPEDFVWDDSPPHYVLYPCPMCGGTRQRIEAARQPDGTTLYGPIHCPACTGLTGIVEPSAARTYGRSLVDDPAFLEDQRERNLEMAARLERIGMLNTRSFPT